MFEEEKTLASEVIERIQSIGRMEEKLENLMNYEVFDDLSKHNPFFHSTDEIASDKLHDLRMKLAYIFDQICDIYALTKNE